MQYLAELQDKSSPNYHKWLTPAQFGKLYGPADSDVAALVAWLESHGLTVETVSVGRTSIAFSGTVEPGGRGVSHFDSLLPANGDQFYSNTTDPQIPTALAPVVKGVADLNTIPPRPQSVRGSTGRFNPESKRLEPAEGISAYLTLTDEPYFPYFLYMVPGDAATIYDTPNSYNANFSSGTSYTGAGVKIGIGGDANDQRQHRGHLPQSVSGQFHQTPPSTIAPPPIHAPAPGSGIQHQRHADEAYIDTELSGGMAPGAAIYYYASSDLITAIEAAIDANVVDIFSLSFGDCEEDMGGSGNAQINSLWEQAAAQGIAVTVSTGDSGSAGCDYNVNHGQRRISGERLCLHAL